MRALALASGLLAISLPVMAQSSPPKRGATYVMGIAFTACRDKDDADRLLKLLKTDDDLAFLRFVRSKLSTGACVRVEQGHEGTIEDNAVFSGLTCIRPRGEPYCLWIPMQMLDAKR